MQLADQQHEVCEKVLVIAGVRTCEAAADGQNFEVTRQTTSPSSWGIAEAGGADRVPPATSFALKFLFFSVPICCCNLLLLRGLHNITVDLLLILYIARTMVEVPDCIDSSNHN